MKISQNPFGKDDKIEFPVNFDLKVIMITQPDAQISIAELESVLVALAIPYENWRYKASGKGTYTSFTVNIDVVSQKILSTLYENLRSVPNVKMAL
ncbi:MAG: hypothetical protein B7C24_09760 [Bacteroidetes bacterium 4572_77]|nr:MAG: hypothetical protein B7C24_09760 [Bacteroidetes bacterium 4572_77]